MTRGTLKYLSFPVAAVAIVMLFALNPVDYAWFPKCPFHEITGLNCPGCGTLRAGHALLHGHVFAAVAFNPLGAASILVGAVALLANFIYPAWVHRIPRSTGWMVLGIVLVYWVARNLPYYPFTLLAP